MTKREAQCRRVCALAISLFVALAARVQKVRNPRGLVLDVTPVQRDEPGGSATVLAGEAASQTLAAREVDPRPGLLSGTGRQFGALEFAA